MKWMTVAVSIGILLGSATRSRADLTYTLTDSKDHLSATADFTYVNDSHGNPIGIEISVTNTSSTHDSAHSISGLVISINSAVLGVPTSLSEIGGGKISYTHVKGNTYTSTTTPYALYSPASSDPNLHWALTKGAGSFTLNALSGGQPQEMIITQNATVSSNVSDFNPFFNGTANFFLLSGKLPTGLTTSVITGVQFNFGTAPEYKKSGTGVGTTSAPPPLPVPEPSSAVLFGVVGVTGFCYAARRRKAKPSA